MIRFKTRGDWKITKEFLNRNRDEVIRSVAERYGRQGVDALAAATPVDTGLTSSSWSYEVTTTKGKTVISWTNSHVVDGVNIAVILQYGHGTKSGGYVQGIDYVNPALRPIFTEIADNAWREVIRD